MNLDSVLLSADSANMQSGGRSIFEKAADALTYGAGAAVVSGLGSIYNTAAYASNSVFGTNADEIDTSKVLGSIDNNWRQYYDDNKGVIDTVGFLGGSFIPGGVAVKAVNAMRLGKGAGIIRGTLGYTAGKQQAYLEAGLQQIATTGGDVFSTLNKNKLISMAYGAVDQALQTAVFETAAAVAMKRSPTLNDENWGDIAWDITKTSLAGGVLGGGIEALWTNKIYRDAGKMVAKRSRDYDTLALLDKTSLDIGDKAFNSLDNLMSLPKEVLEGDKALSFSYKLQGRNYTKELDTSGLYDRKIAQTAQAGILKFQKQLTDAVGSDLSVGSSFSSAMVDIFQEGKKLGKEDGAIKQEIGNFLFNLHGMESLGNTATDFAADIRYLTPNASIRGASMPGATELFSPVRTNSLDLGYRIKGNPDSAKSGVLGTKGVGNTKTEAFDAGYDVVFSGQAGKVHVNPNSKVFVPIADNKDAFLRTTFNNRTKQVSDIAVPTIGDVADNAGVTLTKSGVSAGRFTKQFSAESFEPTLDSIHNTARHLWASTVTDLRGVTVNAGDFSLLDRIVANPDIVNDATKIKLADNSFVSMNEIPSIRNWVFNQKVQRAQELLDAGKGELDTRQVAYALNTEQSWVQDAVTNEFRAGNIDQGTAAFRKLESYSDRDNVVLIYNKPPIAPVGDTAGVPDFETAYTAYRHRVELATNVSQNMSSAILKESGKRFLDIDPNAKINFDETGTGPTGAGFSNADYTDPGRRLFQDMGRATYLTKQEFRDAALNPLQPHFAEIIRDGNKELGAVLAKYRSSDTRLTLWDGKLVDLPSYLKYKQLEEQVLAGKISPDVLQKAEFKTNIKLSDQTYNALSEYHEGHKRWLDNQTALATAQGRTMTWHPDALYLPPVDTKSIPYFAFVRGREGRVMGDSDVGVITAKSAEDLRMKALSVEKDHPEWQVLFKGDTELYKKAQGEYDNARAMTNPIIQNTLRREGKFSDVLPTLEPKAVVEQFVNHIARREDDMVTSAVGLKYSQQISELQFLSEQTTKVERSKLSYLTKDDLKKVTDPFGDYIRLGLDISKKAEYTLWSQANEFVDALGKRAYGAVEASWRAAQEGKQDWIQANSELSKMGLGEAFTNQAQYLSNQFGKDRSLAKIAVAKANMLLANVTLRLDAANALINTISSPITLGMEVSSIRNSIKKNPDLLAQFDSMFTNAVPGQPKLQVPSTMKLLYNAVGAYWSPQKAQLIDRYQNTIGSIRGQTSQFHDMINDLALTPNLNPGEWSKKVDKWTELGAKWTGNNVAEEFTRFVSSNVMQQITDPLVKAGQMSIKEQNSFISIFVNRTQGNYISSQRPVMFQGVIGAAVGLFQTYQFNMFQQLFRHIENRDGKTLAVGAALQGTLFGAQGMPLFDAINTHLIGNANINEQHRDVYSTVAAADKEWGDFAMYGAASALPFASNQAPALYTRGDLNPRHLSIIPTSFSNLPAIEGLSRAVGAVWGIGNEVANGGNFGQSMLHGLEHNGISRPLAGLAQVLQGESTTSKGSIIAANGDLLSISTATRLLGAKPMDESVAMNTKYRLTAYKAADKARLDNLGIAIKDKLRNGQLSEEDVTDFMGRYAAAGGRVESYGAALQHWTKASRESEVNTIMQAHRSPAGQRLLEVMGGDPLKDLVNLPQE